MAAFGLLLSIYVSLYSLSSEAQTKTLQERLIVLYQQQLDLEAARLRIIDQKSKGLNQTTYWSLGYISTPAGKQFLKKEFAERTHHEMRIQFLQDKLAEIKAGSEKEMAQYIKNNLPPRASQLCALSRCTEVLSAVNMHNKSVLDQVLIKSLLNQIETTIKNSNHTFKTENSTDYEDLYSLSLNIEELLFQCNKSLRSVQSNLHLNSKNLSECFYSIIQEELKKGISLDLRTSEQSRYDFKLPKTARLQLETDTEKKVLKWVLEQQDYTLNPGNLFRYCYQIHNGVYADALATCYRTLARNRNSPQFARKLIDIRGDRPRGGDNSGDWYHFYGMMGMQHLQGPFALVAHSSIMGAEHAFHFLTGSDPDMKEYEIGRRGWQTSTALILKILKKSSKSTTLPSKVTCSEERMFSKQK